MRTILKFLGVCLIMSFLGTVTSCERTEPTGQEINPFSNGGNDRNMIVVISDLHLGANLNYAECKNNLGALKNFLNRVKTAPNVKELVIAGDLVDEWFVPAGINTYDGKDQADFVKRVASANKDVFAVMNSIIQEKKILVTYVPGNHDLTITSTSIESILPGINQARDNKLGLGTYTPASNSYIAIEHGHRYNFFCAPDPISNQDIAPGTILPPGYFFTRIAAQYVIQGRPTSSNIVPTVTPPTSGIESQDLLYRYWKNWVYTLSLFPITNKFDENFIITNVNGFTGNYSVNSLLPSQSSTDGSLSVNLYKGIQDNWETRQTMNNVSVHTTAAHAIDSVASETETDQQANLQYFQNPKSGKRIVIFGHTHVPVMRTYTSSDNKKCIYANSGTWIDHNPGRTTMNFVVITPQSSDAASQTLVKLYNYQNEVVTKMAEDALRY